MLGEPPPVKFEPPTQLLLTAKHPAVKLIPAPRVDDAVVLMAVVRISPLNVEVATFVTVKLLTVVEPAEINPEKVDVETVPVTLITPANVEVAFEVVAVK